MIVDSSILAKTSVRKYLREQAKAVIMVSICTATLCILGGIFSHKWDFMLSYLFIVLVFQTMEYQQIKRTIMIMQSENAKALFDIINTYYDFLVGYWKDYNISEAVKIKAQWDAIVNTAATMRELSLITDDVYEYILKTNVSYTTKETQIRLDNMRNK